MAYYKKRLSNFIKLVRPRDGDIVLVKRWKGITKEDEEYILDMFKRRLHSGDEGIICIFVDSLSDVRLLDRRVMYNLLGIREVDVRSDDNS